MRTIDVFLAFPQLVFALLLVSIIGPKLWLIVLAVGLSHAPQVARVLRSAALDVSERPYVKATELQGIPPAKVMRLEILPNLVSPADGRGRAAPHLLDRGYRRPRVPRLRAGAAGGRTGA